MEDAEGLIEQAAPDCERDGRPRQDNGQPLRCPADAATGVHLLVREYGIDAMPAAQCCRVIAATFDVRTGQAVQAISGFALAYGLSQLGYAPLKDRFGKG